MKKYMKLTVAALALAMACTACSSNSAGSQAGASSVSVGSQSASGSSGSEEKVWIITTDTAFMPFEYTDENGDFVGIDVDILAAIAEDQGFEYELQAIGWDGALAAVESGQADALIAGASITQERQETGWIFSDGYYTATQTIAVAADSDISSWEDLRGQNVAVKNGTTGAAYAESLQEEYGFTITKFEDSPTMYQDVLMGNSVACFDDTPVVAANIKQHGLALKIPEGFENEGSPYGFAIMDESKQELLDLFNAGLANIKANGTYDEILETYLG